MHDTSRATQKMRVFRASQVPPLTQGDLAAAIPVSQRQVQRWEAGEHLPSRETMLRLQEMGVCEAGDWYVAAMCPGCERSLGDPAVQACTASGCPRARFALAEAA